MLFSVIVPVKNEIEHIEKSVLSMLELEDRGLGFEILIVDGNSTDGTKQLILDKFKYNPKIHLLDNPKGFTPCAFNIGIKAAKGEFILIAGARHKLDKKYADLCISDLEQNKHLGVSGGCAIHHFKGEVSEAIATAMTSKFGVGGSNFRAIKKSGYVDTVGTPVYRKILFDEIGLFDENLIRNQDDELNFRLYKAGYKAWLNIDAKVEYTVRSNFNNLWKQYNQYGYWKVFVNKKHQSLTSTRQIIPAVFVIYLLLLPFIFLFLKEARVFILIPIFLYIFTIIKISSFGNFNFIRFFLLIRAFLALHFSYGLGYLKGILDFYFLNKQPDKKMFRLSR